ncbi:hypothetical protein EDD18DRAFT_1353404 [Armillaria luteobubalina]|uniref:Uncharacterized protein n=1 Tax=Armillaria luteobubalina TaxID=153913 RepID=A0AA39Q6D7_9AGAR|nr:hypothetical protein EDD18DRAFT_1353404 [Armillaria luteobubalina]
MYREAWGGLQNMHSGAYHDDVDQRAYIGNPTAIVAELAGKVMVSKVFFSHEDTPDHSMSLGRFITPPPFSSISPLISFSNYLYECLLVVEFSMVAIVAFFKCRGTRRMVAGLASQRFTCKELMPSTLVLLGVDVVTRQLCSQQVFIVFNNGRMRFAMHILTLGDNGAPRKIVFLFDNGDIQIRHAPPDAARSPMNTPGWNRLGASMSHRYSAREVELRTEVMGNIAKGWEEDVILLCKDLRASRRYTPMPSSEIVA